MDQITSRASARKRRRFSSPDDEIVCATFPRSTANHDPHFQRLVDQIVEAGPLAVSEILLEVRQRLGGAAWLDDRMAKYASLDAGQLKALGADHWRNRLTRSGGGAS
jgi:hypothetical protein